MYRTDTYLEELPPLLDLDIIDDPLTQFDDSIFDPLMADNKLLSAMLKPAPKILIKTAPVAGTI